MAFSTAYFHSICIKINGYFSALTLSKVECLHQQTKAMFQTMAPAGRFAGNVWIKTKKCLIAGMWKRSAAVAPDVNLRECVTHMPPPSMNKAAHSGFETQMRRHQKSKIGVSVAPQKDLCPPKIFIKVMPGREMNTRWLLVVFHKRFSQTLCSTRMPILPTLFELCL